MGDLETLMSQKNLKTRKLSAGDPTKDVWNTDVPIEIDEK